MSEPTVAKKIGTDLAGSSMTTSLNDFRPVQQAVFD